MNSFIFIFLYFLIDINLVSAEDEFSINHDPASSNFVDFMKRNINDQKREQFDYESVEDEKIKSILEGKERNILFNEKKMLVAFGKKTDYLDVARAAMDKTFEQNPPGINLFSCVFRRSKTPTQQNSFYLDCSKDSQENTVLKKKNDLVVEQNYLFIHQSKEFLNEVYSKEINGLIEKIAIPNNSYEVKISTFIIYRMHYKKFQKSYWFFCTFLKKEDIKNIVEAEHP